LNGYEERRQARGNKEENEMDYSNAIPERMKEIEIFGVPALFTDKPIPPEAVYPGMFRYELRSGQDRQLRCQADGPDGKFLGTVLTPVPIPMDGQREIGLGELVLDTGAGCYTPSEFEEKYLSPNYDPAVQEERFGKR